MLVGLFALFASSCTNEASLQGDEPQAPEKSAIRTEEEAIQIAQNLACANQKSRSSVAIASVDRICSNPSRGEENPLIYAVNYADNGGYALISAAKTGIDVLGVVEEGKYSEPETETGFSFYMENAKNYVQERITIQTPDTLTPQPGAPVITTETLVNKVSCNWGPGYVENRYCEDQRCGSGPLAMAMMLSSGFIPHNLIEPEILQLTYPERKTNQCELLWNFITRHVSIENVNLEAFNCPGQKGHEGLSQLLREIEFRSDTYHRNEIRIVTDIHDARETMAGLTPTIEYTEEADLLPIGEEAAYNMLAKGKIMYVSGCDEGATGKNPRPKREYNWLIDGGKKITSTGWAYDIYGNRHDFVEIDYLLHCNWGNFGHDNGYFSFGVFKTYKSGSVINFDYSSRLRYFTQK